MELGILILCILGVFIMGHLWIISTCLSSLSWRLDDSIEDLPEKIALAISSELKTQSFFSEKIASAIRSELVREDLPEKIASAISSELIMEDFPRKIASAISSELVREDLPEKIASAISSEFNAIGGLGRNIREHLESIDDKLYR